MLNFTKEKIAVFFILTLLLFQSGCKRKNVAYDSRLVAAERLMEEHPDSAMMILDTISVGAFDSAADRAFYNLLLTQARKNSPPIPSSHRRWISIGIRRIANCLCGLCTIMLSWRVSSVVPIPI